MRVLQVKKNQEQPGNVFRTMNKKRHDHLLFLLRDAINLEHHYYVLLFFLAVRFSTSLFYAKLSKSPTSLGSNILVRVIEGLIQEKHTGQSDSTVHLMGVFGKLLSLHFYWPCKLEG